MRLIDADSLKRRTQRVATQAWKMNIHARVETVLNQFIDFINEAPTVDVAPVRHARWLVNEKMRWIVCSACGTNVPIVTGCCMDANINYCPHCGAKME